MVSFKRLKNDKVKNKEVLDDKHNLLQADQKESNYSKSKSGRLRLSLFSKGRSKRHNASAKNSPEYEPPTAPSSPADKTPLNVTVLTSAKFDQPYAVHRADTNISDLTPHVIAMPGRKVEFDPSLTKPGMTPIMNNTSNPENHQLADQPPIRGVSGA